MAKDEKKAEAPVEVTGRYELPADVKQKCFEACKRIFTFGDDTITATIEANAKGMSDIRSIRLALESQRRFMSAVIRSHYS